MDPEKQDSIRNPDGTFKEGISGNPLGRPKGKTLKEFAREYYMLKTDDEKRAYIEEVEKKKPGFAWTMAEGNPHQGIEHSGEVTQKQYIINRGDSSNQSVPAPQESTDDHQNES